MFSPLRVRVYFSISSQERSVKVFDGVVNVTSLLKSSLLKFQLASSKYDGIYLSFFKTIPNVFHLFFAVLSF